MTKVSTSITGIVLLLMLICTRIVVAQPPDPGFDRLSEPLENITEEQRAEFFEGLEVFERNFIGEGVDQIGGGPLVNGVFSTRFNGNSCVTCHNLALNPDGTNDIRKDGGNGNFRAVQATAWHESTESCDHLEDIGGPGFQRRISDDQLITPLAQDRQDAIDAGLDEYVPIESSHGVAVGPVDSRTTNDLFGLGLVDAVLDSTIVALADPDDANGDGISGRVHWVGNHVGKFGRKAEEADLDGFSAEALLNEQGVTNPEHLSEGVIVVAKNPDGSLLTMPLDDGVADPEASEEEMHALNMYMRLLAPAMQNKKALSGKERAKGLVIFNSIGCKDCHTKSMRTGPHEIKALNNTEIQPFSDFLLHYMGDSLAEGCKGDAWPGEWRSEPLWGLRFVHQFLHDGRAGSVEEAIEMHANDSDSTASEAAGSVAAFRALSEVDKTRLLNFLNTL